MVYRIPVRCGLRIQNRLKTGTHEGGGPTVDLVDQGVPMAACGTPDLFLEEVSSFPDPCSDPQLVTCNGFSQKGTLTRSVGVDRPGRLCGRQPMDRICGDTQHVILPGRSWSW